MKKIIVTIAFFSLSLAVNAQEPVNENKGNQAPPSSGKAINEKGVSSVKTRSLTKKTNTTKEGVPAGSSSITPANDNIEQHKPQQEPKKEIKDPKKGSSSEKAINEKGVSSVKTRNLKKRPKAVPSKTATTDTKK